MPLKTGEMQICSLPKCAFNQPPKNVSRLRMQFKKTTSARSQKANLLRSDSNRMQIHRYQHIALAPKLNVLDATVRSLEVQAGKRHCNCEISFHVGLEIGQGEGGTVDGQL